MEETIRVIDSDKVPTLDSINKDNSHLLLQCSLQWTLNHIVHVGDGMSLPPKTGALLLFATCMKLSRLLLYSVSDLP